MEESHTLPTVSCSPTVAIYFMRKAQYQQPVSFRVFQVISCVWKYKIKDWAEHEAKKIPE